MSKLQFTGLTNLMRENTIYRITLHAISSYEYNYVTCAFQSVVTVYDGGHIFSHIYYTFLLHDPLEYVYTINAHQ